MAEAARRPSVISHEIRTPIALISGAAELLEERMAGDLNPQQKQFVQTISENSAQVIAIAENFLTELRLDSNATLHPQRIDIRQLVAQTARELRRTSQVPLQVEATGGLLEIYADSQLVRQLLWNLINNAMRHGESDSAVTVRVLDGEGGGALISVTDSGTGMSDADIERIFEPFTTGTGRRAGTGIGMMVAKKIVEAHHGRIMVDSSEGAGTAIHVLLPQGTPPSEAAPPSAVTPRSGAARLEAA